MIAEHELLDALRRLRVDSDVTPAPMHVSRARAAMHAAVAERAERDLLRRLASFLAPVRLRLAGGLVGVTAAAVVALGWSAAPGAPLHAVQLVREWVQLSLPNSDHAALVLSFAEQRLREARVGDDASDALAEAQRLLAECPQYLPADHATREWQRWEADEALLRTLVAASAAPAAHSPADTTPGAPGATAPPSTSDQSRGGPSGATSGSSDGTSGGPGPSGGGSNGPSGTTSNGGSGTSGSGGSGGGGSSGGSSGSGSSGSGSSSGSGGGSSGGSTNTGSDGGGSGGGTSHGG